MKLNRLFCFLAVAACIVGGAGESAAAQQTVTLYRYRNDSDRSTYNFERASHAAVPDADLIYGTLQIGEDLDWFDTTPKKGGRSLILDLGARNWSDGYEVPVLTPLPKLREGETRTVTVDASAKTGKAWAGKNGVFAKAVAGHMYVMHVVDDDSDFYVMFRVESVTPGDNCTISWQIISPPAPQGEKR